MDRHDDFLDVVIDNDLEARLQIGPDGELDQISGNQLPESTITFIKKQVLELNQS